MLGIGVSAVSLIYLVVLPAILVGLIYLFISVYAIVKISPPGHPNPTVVLLGVVGLVGLLTVLLGVSIWVTGRAFEPPKTRRQPRR
ncbi:MAG: hypothetical protein QOI60_783 [Actinomycetota bacterium]|nr:hypothetical protein [Actinomycetota bacterium]